MRVCISFVVVVLLLLPLGGASRAETGIASQTSEVKVTEEDAFQYVRKLMMDGAFDAAIDVLKQLQDSEVDQIQVLFLFGQIATLQGEWAAAQYFYREILIENPDIVRVRLELARALFEAKDDEAARYHFRQVLAQPDMSPAARANVRRYLEAIQARKTWALSFSLSVSPDSNVNAAPDSQSIDLFGLPFELSDDARQTSGFGVSASVGGSYTYKAGGLPRLESRAVLDHTEYFDNGAFNDTFFTARIGPAFDVGNNTIHLMANGGYRRFGGQDFSYSYGGQLSLDKQIGNRLYVTGALDIQYQDFVFDNSRDGTVVSTVIQASYLSSKSRVLRGHLGATHENARVESRSSQRYRVGAGYRRELPWGVTVDFSLEYMERVFEAPDFLTGAKREDQSTSVSLGITKRDLEFYGFVPTFGYTYINNDSNNTLHTFERHRGRAGLTRIF